LYRYSLGHDTSRWLDNERRERRSKAQRTSEPM